MKIIYSTLFFIACTASVNAQFSLTKNINEPIVGDVYYTKTLDTNGTALPNTVTGNNVTWTILNVIESNTIVTNNYSSNGGNASNFPGTTIVQEDATNGNFSYYKVTPTSFELVGAELNFSGASGELNYNTNSAIIAQYPIAFGYNLNDPIGGTVSANGQTGPFTGNIVTKGDGTGTLKLNNTTFTNCIRVKTTQHATFTLAGGFVMGIFDQVVYNYFNSSNKFPLFSTNYAHIQTSGAFTVNQKTADVSALNSVALGLNSNSQNDVIFKAYPNPANSEVNIHFVLTQPESYTIEIVNTLGQTVRSLSKPNLVAGMYSETISLSGLTTGVYHINVIGKNTKGVAKLVIQ